MKKILYILLFLFLLTGCNNEDVSKINEKDKIETKYKVKYNKYVVEYINHDNIINSNYDEKNIVIENIYLNDKEDTTVDNIYSSNKEDTTVDNVYSSNKEDISFTEEDKQIMEEEILNINNDVMDTFTEKEEVHDNKTEEFIEEVDNEEDVKVDIPINEENSNINEIRPVKVIDVSYYQGDVNWDVFKQSNEYYGVILRLGYYNVLDAKFERNLNELKRLNIPYGIYLFSYSTTTNGANIEANFTNNMIKKYDIKPTLGIYYDIESWKTKTLNSDSITKKMYDDIITLYINKVSNFINYEYKVKVYSGRWYAMNRLGISKKYVDWVAEYNDVCKYDGIYSMWQYTSKGSVPGIVGNTDISYLY